MESDATEIRFLKAAIEKHQHNIYTLELQAIDYGPLAVPLHLSNAITLEQEQLVACQERLDTLLPERLGDTARPARGAPPALLPGPALSITDQPAVPTIHFGEGTRLTGVNLVIGARVDGDLTQTTDRHP